MANEKSTSEIIDDVRHLAIRELEYCNEQDTPAVCQMIQTEEGKKQIVDLIVEYVGKRGISISDAIVAIERERTDLD